MNYPERRYTKAPMTGGFAEDHREALSKAQRNIDPKIKAARIEAIKRAKQDISAEKRAAIRQAQIEGIRCAERERVYVNYQRFNP